MNRLQTTVAIIGTGFSGIAAAIALARAGIDDFILLEKCDDIGGTWRDNQYPGACCDVPSHLYSFSFELNPDWSRRFSPAAEIHAYQHRVIEKHGLRDRIKAGFEVATARWSQDGWVLGSTRDEVLHARYVISAIGALHIPNKPDFAGLGEFSGKVMHSAEWDHGYDWAGKDIVVVGSAASAIQIVPKLAQTAARVSVMQRSPNYFIPRKDRGHSRFARALYRKQPWLQKLVRWRQYLFNDFLFHANFMTRGSPAKWYVHRMVRKHMRRSVSDPQLRSKLTPDYALGCKRILLSDDFLPAVQQANVELVTEPINHFYQDGLVTDSGREVRAELVVLATGFKTTRLFGDMQITGPGGMTMEQAWETEIRAHRSVAVCGFPNFFMMYGPNSNLGHSSIIIMIETQATYLARLLGEAEKIGAHVVNAKPAAEAAWNEKIQAALRQTVWATECRSWYKDSRGHIFSLWPHSTTRFIREMRKAPLDEYEFS